MTDPLLRYAAALDAATEVRQTKFGAIPVDVNGIDMLDRALSLANDEIETLRHHLARRGFEVRTERERAGVLQDRLKPLLRRNASLTRRLNQARREQRLVVPAGSVVSISTLPVEVKHGDR